MTTNTLTPQALPNFPPTQQAPITADMFETVLPPEPSIWPLAIGWYVIFALIIVAIIIGIALYLMARKKARVKRAALELVEHIDTQLSAKERVLQAYDLHRQVCLSYYPRHLLADLHSQHWYTFLDNQLKLSNARPLFMPNQQHWQDALYRSTPMDDKTADYLISCTKKWIDIALPPSKKQLDNAYLFASMLNEGNENTALFNGLPQDRA